MTEGNPRRPRLLAIVGPTAAGKSVLGRQVAERFGLTVLVCDSVKVYRGLDIGSAKPSPDERSRVSHELIDLVDPDQAFSAGDYAEHALARLARAPGVLVGGTGFYLATLATRPTTVGGNELGVDEPRRAAFEQGWRARETDEPGSIHRALNAIDSETAAKIHPHNQVRALRALWLCELAGGPVSEARRADPPKPRFDLLTVVLDPGRAELDAAIETRVARMLSAGWLAEVEKLRAAGYDGRYKAMASLGYRQLLDVVEGRTSLEAARDQIVTATRHYARRQRTYFRHQLGGEIVPIRHASELPWGMLADFLGRKS